MLRVLPALLLVAALVAACGTSKTQPLAQSAPGARVSVTADWGATPIANGRGNVGTVIAATGGVAQLTTGYGGRYVTAIDGQAGDGTRDWIFWINGIESAVGGADVEVAAGDRVWWDLHRWNGRVNVPAVVAEWPLPLTRGLDGPHETLSADEPLASELRTAGAEVSAPAAAEGARALVGASDELRQRDPLWRRAVDDTAAAGLTAWIDPAGQVQVWNADRGAAEAVPGATAVIVATTDGYTASDPPVVIIAGVSQYAAFSAAEALIRDPALVRNAAAICLDADGRVVCRGGRGRVPGP